MFEVLHFGALAAAIIGAFIGSFIHAMALRLPSRQSVLGPPVCRQCDRPLPSASLFPFNVSGQRCRNCGDSDGWHKPVTELASAAISGFAILSHGISVEGIATAVFSLNLLLILRIDWQHHLIYSITIWPGVVIALGFAALQSTSALLSSLIAAVIAGALFSLFFALAVWIYKRHALGFGDILLAILIGAMAGIELVGGALLLGMMLAAVGGLLLVAIGKRGRYDYIPYGAYLCAGTIIVLLLPQ